MTAEPWWSPSEVCKVCTERSEGWSSTSFLCARCRRIYEQGGPGLKKKEARFQAMCAQWNDEAKAFLCYFTDFPLTDRVLGRALIARGDVEGATTELRSAVALADELGSPDLRWQSRAVLTIAERNSGAGERAEEHAREVTEIIDTIVGGLSPERATTYLAAAPVVEALDLAR